MLHIDEKQISTRRPDPWRHSLPSSSKGRSLPEGLRSIKPHIRDAVVNGGEDQDLELIQDLALNSGIFAFEDVVDVRMLDQ